jgi:cellulose synthase (UDP-forming)
VLDEGRDQSVRDLCDRYGAHYWSRKDIPEFNQPDWPHQAKTKSGNYNSWFVDVAYDRYEYLVQLDSDHAPIESYLDDILGYFDDPDIAYIAFPSIYWNLDDWPARGSSEQSQIFQGPIQMGYYGWAESPMIIGSHAAYRVAHLKEIGGFAPSRAEDHLDTLRFVQHGYRGVFVPENMATGLGPHTLTDYIVQEHQWAFSIAQVLMLHARHKGLLTLRQRAVFLFSELWYSRFALTYLALYLLPLLALITNRPLVSLAFVDFMKYSILVSLAALLVVAWGYRQSWYRPGTHFFLSWQGIILTAARWPIVLIALFNAVVSVLFRGGAFNYMVTPKGRSGLRARDSLRAAMPYILLAAVPVAVILAYPWIIQQEAPRASGYVLFAMISAVLFSLLVLAGAVDHIRNNVKTGMSRWPSVKGAVPLILIVAMLASGIVLGTMVNASTTRDALAYRPESAAMVGIDDPVEPPADHQPPAIDQPDDAPVLVSDTPVPEPTATPLPPPTIVPETVAVASWIIDPDRQGLSFGAFDPHAALDDINGINHLYVEWAADETGGIPLADIEATYARGVPVMLTWEPWPLDGYSPWVVLSDTANGKYDDVIRSAAETVAAIDQPILIRFAHEMDITGLYPWSGKFDDRYIAAYQHVVDIFREEGATNVLWVWSPGGTLDAGRYYPGDAYVDYVGYTVLQYTDWELDAGYDEPRPVKDLINEKYRLFQTFGKPMIVAEFGIAIDPDLEDDALADTIASLPYFPEIRAVLYFNDRNPVTPLMTERPDWTLSDAQREILANALADLDAWLQPLPLIE